MKKISKYLNYEVEQFSTKYKQKKETELNELGKDYTDKMKKITDKWQEKIDNDTRSRLLLHKITHLKTEKRRLENVNKNKRVLMLSSKFKTYKQIWSNC